MTLRRKLHAGSSQQQQRLRLNQVEKELLAGQLRSVILGLRHHLLGRPQLPTEDAAEEEDQVDQEDTDLSGYLAEGQWATLQPSIEQDLKEGKIWVEKSAEGLPELCLSVGNCLRIENRLIAGTRPTFLILCSCIPADVRYGLQERLSEHTGKSLENQVSGSSYCLMHILSHLSKCAPGQCLQQMVNR